MIVAELQRSSQYNHTQHEVDFVHVRHGLVPAQTGNRGQSLKNTLDLLTRTRTPLSTDRTYVHLLNLPSLTIPCSIHFKQENRFPQLSAPEKGDHLADTGMCPKSPSLSNGTNVIWTTSDVPLLNMAKGKNPQRLHSWASTLHQSKGKVTESWLTVCKASSKPLLTLTAWDLFWLFRFM